METQHLHDVAACAFRRRFRQVPCVIASAKVVREYVQAARRSIGNHHDLPSLLEWFVRAMKHGAGKSG